ncbi:MAG: ATP-binding protein [Candidatus Didemnitutus sp.]|nr:ATP-binding protein [Candidatus Didemnitutus sp.]
MTRLLLITEDQNQALTLQGALASAADFQVHHRSRFADARGALTAGAFEACLFLPANVEADFCTELAAARALAPRLAIAVVAPSGAGTETQPRLLSAGADSVLFQPLDVAALATNLTRLTGRGETPTVASANPFAGPALAPARLNAKAAALSSALEVLRDFSQVLGYSLDYRQLTHQFILKLREVVGVSRIAIFLEPGTAQVMPTTSGPDGTTLTCAAAVGIPADLVECFALTRKSGLGRQLSQQPQILRAPTQTVPPQLDPKIVREFEVLGGQVAIPVNDRERTIGIAILGDRITGGEFSDEELLLVYHLLEELGLAVKNSWLHDQLVGSHKLFGSVLSSLTVGALVIGPNQQVAYANRAIIDFLLGARADRLDVHDLPPAIAARLHDVVEKGVEADTFFHETAASPPRLFRATIIPLRQPQTRLPQTAMLLLEDFTSIRAGQQAEIESSNLKLISLIARRFAHEIRNSLVPLTTHAQLFDSEIAHDDFRESLKASLHRETQRIQRFTDQMLLLARADQPPEELASLDEILRSSFEKSRAFSGGEANLEIKSELPPVMLRCNRASLAHAFQEIFLNGLQSSHDSSRRVVVSLNAAPNTEGRAELVITVRDSGTGFALESAPRATEPFFTTRNTGVGLGLTIAQRVISAHDGSLAVHPRQTPADADLTIRLPLPR